MDKVDMRQAALKRDNRALEGLLARVTEANTHDLALASAIPIGCRIPWERA